MTPDEPIPGTQTLARGMAVVEAVWRGASSLGEVVSAVGIGRSTVHRLIQELQRQDWLASGEDGRLALGPALISYGYSALGSISLAGAASDVMKSLHERELDTVHLGVRQGDEVLYLGKLDGLRGAEMRSRIGGRMPLARTGLGMALLLDSGPEEWRKLRALQHGVTSDRADDVPNFVARMTEYKHAGATLDLEDNEIGIRCVAAPIRDAQDAITGSISLTATTPFMPFARMRNLVPTMIRAAQQVSERLGRRT